MRFIDVRTQWFDDSVKAAVRDGIKQVGGGAPRVTLCASAAVYLQAKPNSSEKGDPPGRVHACLNSQAQHERQLQGVG